MPLPFIDNSFVDQNDRAEAIECCNNVQDSDAGSFASRGSTSPFLPNPSKKPTLTVPEAGALFGLGKDQAYRAVKSGAIPSIRLSERRLVVPTARVLHMLGLDQSRDSSDAGVVEFVSDTHGSQDRVQR